MIRKFLIVLLMSCLIVLNCVPAYAATLTTQCPNFEEYAKASGYDLSSYPYYVIYAYESGGYLKYQAYFATSNFILIENSDTSGGSWSTTYYRGWFTLTDFVGINVTTDFDGNYVSNKIVTDESMGYSTTYMYIDINSKFLYSNHNIIEKHTNNDVEVVFRVAPYSQGQKAIIGTTISHQVMLNLLEKQIVGLIPLALPLATSLMALRKALIALFRLLARI